MVTTRTGNIKTLFFYICTEDFVIYLTHLMTCQVLAPSIHSMTLKMHASWVLASAFLPSVVVFHAEFEAFLKYSHLLFEQYALQLDSPHLWYVEPKFVSNKTTKIATQKIVLMSDIFKFALSYGSINYSQSLQKQEHFQFHQEMHLHPVHPPLYAFRKTPPIRHR